MPKINTILFDLDGTLVDTAPDMGGALNAVRIERGLEAMPLDNIRPHVSMGGPALITLGFNIDTDHPDHEPLRQRFLHHYSQQLASNSCLFGGMEELLQTLESRQLKWGIITNKPGWLTDPLLQELSLYHRSGCVVSGDTVAKAKPHPMPLLHACKIIQSEPEECLYVGDHERDIIAGNAAKMTTLAALWGYITEADNPDNWGADGQVSHSEQILDWII